MIQFDQIPQEISININQLLQIFAIGIMLIVSIFVIRRLPKLIG